MERKPITVSALTRYIKYRIDNDVNLQDVLLRAEISNFKRHSRGHFYFTLKDEESQIGAVMFSSAAKTVPFDPKDGDKVLVEGRITVYEPQGNYQLYVAKMTLDGVGDLYLAYEKLKARLESLGWFDPSRKRPIPRFPRTVGVVTSPTGAAVRDIIHIINRRYPLCRILVYPAIVQGDGAKQSISAMIEKANRDAFADVLIVGRGGGSIEDLWAFNEEMVADAIRRSKIPVISAVGHETDFTIADFVADLRAPTPSGAAELAVPDSSRLDADVAKLAFRAEFLVSGRIRAERARLSSVLESFAFRNPLRLTETARLRFLHATERLEGAHPARVLEKHAEKTGNLAMRLDSAFRGLLDRRVQSFRLMAEKMELLNPLGLMKKGYSVLRKGPRILRSIEEMAPGDRVEAVLSDGTAECIVETLRKDE